MSFDQFKISFSLNVDFVTYYGVTSAIPSNWKRELNSLTTERIIVVNTETKLEKLQSLNRICKETYPLFVNKLIESEEIPKGVMKWGAELHLKITEKMESIFDIIYTCTKSTKLRSCQYHLLHKSLVTNVDLLKWNLANDDKCTFCKCVPESLSHIYLTCTVSITLWRDLEQWLFQKTGILIRCTYPDIVFGFQNDVNGLFNLITLITKQYIYSCRCQQKTPCKRELVYRIKAEKEIEHEAAKLYGKIGVFEQKWLPLIDAFSDL